MKVFFLNPPFLPYFSREERSPQVAKAKTIYYPVWLAQTAGYIETKGYEISLKDAVSDNLSVKECSDWVKTNKPDYLVIETSTPSIHFDKETAKSIKIDNPDVKIIFVGTHVTSKHEETLNSCKEVDYLIIGEYELALESLLSSLSNNENLSQVQGIAYRDKDQVRVNEKGLFLEDLDQIPFASKIYKRFLNYKNYFFAAANYPGIMLMTGRGCQNQCRWCLFNQTIHGRKYRFRSPEKIVEEFEYIIENFSDVKEIWIDDDTFTANKKHLHEVLDLIIKKKLKFKKGSFKWYCNARPPLDLDTMKVMKKAGCRLVVTGFESGDEQILKNMRKGFTLERSYEFMQNAKKAHILVHGCFVVGNIGETKNTMKKTLDYAKKLLPDSAQFYFIHPYPGTDYYKYAESNNYLITTDYSKWLYKDGSHRCVINLPDISTKEMEDFCNKAYKKYHFSLKYILMKLKQLFLNPQEGLRSIKAFLNFISK